MTTEILMPALSPTMEEGKLAKWLVKEGDKVLYSKYAGNELKFEGKEFIIMKETDILAVIG